MEHQRTFIDSYDDRRQLQRSGDVSTVCVAASSIICALPVCPCLPFIWIVLFLSCVKLLMSDCGSVHRRQVAQTISVSAAILFLQPGTCYRVFLAGFAQWLCSPITDTTFNCASVSLAFRLSFFPSIVKVPFNNLDGWVRGRIAEFVLLFWWMLTNWLQVVSVLCGFSMRSFCI